MIHSEVTAEAIDVTALEAMLTGTGNGAVVSFRGAVRHRDGRREVSWLTYEGHPDAPRVLEQVASDVARSHGLDQVVVSHRIGERLVPGELALYAVVATPHRAAAFAGCAALVDEVKLRLPVWKHQMFGDGTDEWVNSP